MTVEVPKEQQRGEGPRQLIDLALSCGRRFQSPQTGFIHYGYGALDEDSGHAAPVVDNFLWVLTLLRTRVADRVREAKGILDRVLCYQNTMHDDSRGNFPASLHDYPHCKDRYLAYHLLGILFRIEDGYGKVLGDDLKQRVKEASKGLLDYCWITEAAHPAPYHMAIKLGAAAVAFGALYQNEQWQKDGQSLLEKQQQKGVTSCCFSPDRLGDIILALGLVTDDISSTAWEPLWRHINDTWHRPTNTYIGPALRERQREGEPQGTVYDLVMGYLSAQYSYRAYQVHPYQLQAAMIYPSKQLLPDLKIPHLVGGEFSGRRWTACHMPSYGYGMIEQNEAIERSQQYRTQSFRMVWGNTTYTHSLCMQGGNVEKLTFSDFEMDRVQLSVQLLPEDSEMEREKNYDLSFYVDNHQSLKKTVAGKHATTFELGQEVVLKDEFLAATLVIQAGDEKAQYLGHIRPGNRPAQMGLKGTQRFNAYDEEVIVRAVRSEGLQTLKIDLRMTTM